MQILGKFELFRQTFPPQFIMSPQFMIFQKNLQPLPTIQAPYYYGQESTIYQKWLLLVVVSPITFFHRGVSSYRDARSL